MMLEKKMLLIKMVTKRRILRKHIHNSRNFTHLQGPFKKYVHFEGDGGGTQKASENVQREGDLFDKRMYAYVIVKRLVLAKHPK